jgi:hypothetical protein
MFRLLGVLVALYTLYSALRGEVYARFGAGGRSVNKLGEPGWFWTIIVIYTGLSLALMFVF